jgi:S1-C subfamily serine protease
MTVRLSLALFLILVASGQALGAAWGWLGVRIRDITEQEMEEISTRHGIGEGFGALIVEVLPETPAARDGLRNGDLVVAFKGRPVVDTRMLQRLVARTPLGEAVALTVLRQGEGRRPVTVRIGTMPREVVAERVSAEFGFVVREPVEDRGGLPPAARSTVPMVGFVVQGSQAERAGLRSGDVIVEVNEKGVLSRQAVWEILADTSIEQPLTLRVKRGQEQVRLTLAPPR